jgi:putative transposase
MHYNPEIHHRRSIRLKGYDYSTKGAYFLTLCTYQNECLFGEIINGEMYINEYGQIVTEEWMQSSIIRKEIELDESVVMPNHFHAIVFINPDIEDTVGAQGIAPSSEGIAYRKSKSISTLVAGFKTAVTKRINILRNAPGNAVWQRNYYENIIRNENALDKIRQYTINNPSSWEVDKFYPK